MFEGNTKIKSDVLISLADDIIGKEVYFEDLLAYALRVSRYYQSRGYLTSYAYVPEQQIKEGVVKVMVSESLVDNVDISGNKWARTCFLKNIIIAIVVIKVMMSVENSELYVKSDSSKE